MKLLLLMALGIMATVAEDSQLMTNFATGNHQFTAEVYGELLKVENGNFLVCPLSAEIVLALVHAGAQGKTAQELSDVLHLPESKQEVQQIMHEFTPHLKGNDNYNLNSANKIYVKKDGEISANFKNIALNVFDAAIQNIDFTQTAQALNEMNGWVEEKTAHKIKNLISPSDVKPDTLAVLINAMYFLGKWAQPFKKEHTDKGAFHLSSNNQIQVDMMNIQRKFRYHEDSELDAKFLELPYAGGSVTMTIVLPNKKDGLAQLEARVSDIFASPEYQFEEVIVKLPKFKIETKIKFTDILKSLGVRDAFTSAARFEDILVQENLIISEVIQKTFIEVDEKGTEAAAATFISMRGYSAHVPTSPKEFIADHPFIFYIKIKDVVFFAGRYTSP